MDGCNLEIMRDNEKKMMRETQPVSKDTFLFTYSLSLLYIYCSSIHPLQSSSSSSLPLRTSFMKMRRNCNLELCLFPSHDSSHNHHQHHPKMGEGNNNNDDDEREMSGEDEGQQQKLTIFYDGKVCISDVTHLQARRIMKEASKEMAEEEKIMTKRSLTQSHEREMNSPSTTTTNNNNNNINNTSLSMKRSLQHFLQKRKARILHSSPYYHP